MERMKKLGVLLFAAWFLPVAALLLGVAALFRLARVRSVVRAWHALRKERRVLFLEPFFPENAGYHYRALRWAEVLREKGTVAHVRHVLSREEFEGFLSEGRITRFHGLFLLRRLRQVLGSLRYRCVVVRRELLLYNDYGNLFADRLLLSLHPDVVLDFDDDIAAAKQEPRELTPFGRLMLERSSKFNDSLRLYPRFIVGTHYLKSCVRERSSGVADDDILVVPTCVDYAKYPPKVYRSDRKCVSFGWVGSVGNLRLLDIVLPALSEVARRHPLRVVVISGREYRPDVDFEVVNVPWSLGDEVENLRRIDVGLMPLHDTAVERGKCGFKLIQYMGLGIVSIASAITVNREIVDDGRNGFLVHQVSDWAEVIEAALEQWDRFPEIGAAARERIRQGYSFAAHEGDLVRFLRPGTGRAHAGSGARVARPVL